MSYNLKSVFVGVAVASTVWAAGVLPAFIPTLEEQNTRKEGLIQQFHRAVSNELAEYPGGYRQTALKPSQDGLGFEAVYGNDVNPDMARISYTGNTEMRMDTIRISTNQEIGPVVIQKVLEDNTNRLPSWLPDTTPY